MNSSAELIARLSDRFHDGFNNLTKPVRERFVPLSPGPASEIIESAQAEVSVPMAEPTKAASEALGVGVVVAFVLALGTMWAWIVVQLAVMISQVEPFLVRNILWTHQ